MLGIEVAGNLHAIARRRREIELEARERPTGGVDEAPRDDSSLGSAVGRRRCTSADSVGEVRLNRLRPARQRSLLMLKILVHRPAR